MKKHSILFLALLAAVSCQKENTQDIAPVFEPNVELRASFDEQSSRIATEDGLTFSLEEGKEQIGVYINLGDTSMYDNVLYTAGSADEQGWISFSTDVPVHVQSNSKFFAYAPYSATTVDVSGSTDSGASEPSAAGSGWNGKRAINLPDLQEQPAAGVKTDIAKYYSVVAAPATPVARDVLESYSVNLQFSGVFALVRFGLNNFTEGEIKVSKIVFSAENAALTGYFSVDLTHENPKLSNTEYAPEAVADKTFDKVTVTLAEPATIAAQEMAEVYAVVNACAVTTPKLTVYATDAEGKDIVFEKTLSDKTFSRQQRTAIGVKLENPVAADYAQEVIDALKNGGTVKIEKDVDLSEKPQIEIPEGTTVNIEVPAGVTVKLSKDGENKRIMNYGDVTISGEGTIESAYGIMRNYNTLTIDGGNFKTTNWGGGTAFVNEQNATMIINNANIDAEYWSLYNDRGTMTVNNAQVSTLYCALFNNNGTVTVNGGSFKSLSDNKREWAYSVMARGENAVTTIGEIGADDSEIFIAGVQGAASSDTNAKLIINSGTFATYFTQDGEELNFYALYTATGGTATVNGGRFYRENNTSNRPCIYIGNNDTGTTLGYMELNGGYYKDCGQVQNTTETVAPATGYKWVELETPITETVEFFGKQYTNTYYYQIVEGEDLGYKEVEGGYEIYSAKGLQWLAEQVNGGDNFSGKTVALTADIDLENAEWTPIGTTDNPFAGKFDGGSKTISNLNVNSPEEAFKGLFGRLVTPGTISNVNINNAAVTGYDEVGAIVGSAYTGSVSNCHVSGDILIEGHYHVGGITGYGYATISNCSVIGNAGSYVKGTYMKADFEGDAVGGIIGYAAEKNSAEAKVISECSAAIDVIGTRKVGGIAGQCGKDANVYGCTFSGNVSTNADETYIAANAGKIMVGGLVGELTGSSLFIKNSTVAEGSTVTGVDAKTTGAILGGSRTAGYALTEENNTATGVTVTPDDGVQVSTAEEAVAAIQGGGKVTVAGAIDKIDFTALNPTAPVELVLNAKVDEIVLGSSASNPAQTTITVAKDVDYPTFSVVGGNDIQNLTIIGDPTSSKVCTSGINALNQSITTVKNVTIKGVRFQGKGVHFGFTANPQTTQNIVIEDCEGIDMVEPLFQTSNNKYVNTLVGDITIRNNKATFSASAANTVNALYICVTTAGTVLIENNTFINPPKHGIMADSNACENFIVRGNTFTNPVEDGVKIDYPVNNVLIENNTITPTEYGIRVARFKSDYNPTVTISGNRIDMSNAKDETFNGISIAGSEANGQAKLVIKENVKVGGSVTEWLSINSALVLNDGSDVATPFNN